MSKEFDTKEQAQIAADNEGDNYRCVYLNRVTGKYGYDCLIQQPPHDMVYSQRNLRIVSRHYANYPMAKKGWQDD